MRNIMVNVKIVATNSLDRILRSLSSQQHCVEVVEIQHLPPHLERHCGRPPRPRGQHLRQPRHLGPHGARSGLPDDTTTCLTKKKKKKKQTKIPRPSLSLVDKDDTEATRKTRGHRGQYIGERENKWPGDGIDVIRAKLTVTRSVSPPTSNLQDSNHAVYESNESLEEYVISYPHSSVFLNQRMSYSEGSKQKGDVDEKRGDEKGNESLSKPALDKESQSRNEEFSDCGYHVVRAPAWHCY